MAANLQTARLNQLQLAAFKPLFASLSAPPVSSITGIFQAEFTGPAWLRKIAAPGLSLAGLRAWWGKTFDGEGGGANLVTRQGALQCILPINVALLPSALDGRPSLVVRYTRGCHFPWLYVVDELRLLDETCLLALSYVDRRALRGLPLPFLLYRPEAQHAG